MNTLIMSSDFEKLIQENSARIYRIAQQYAAVGEVDDLVQNILMQLWRSYEQFRGEAKIETWIYRIALNTSMTQLRKNIRHREIQVKAETNLSTSEGAPSGGCQKTILANFLSSLGDVDASILMMYLDGLSAKEMADILGIKLNAVQVRINRMKQKFTKTYVE